MLGFAERKPAVSVVRRLDAAIKGNGELPIADREIFLYCPYGYGTTKLNNIYFKKHLGVIATTRNRKTVTTLLEMTRQIAKCP